MDCSFSTRILWQLILFFLWNKFMHNYRIFVTNALFHCIYNAISMDAINDWNCPQNYYSSSSMTNSFECHYCLCSVFWGGNSVFPSYKQRTWFLLLSLSPRHFLPIFLSDWSHFSNAHNLLNDDFAPFETWW